MRQLGAEGRKGEANDGQTLSRFQPEGAPGRGSASRDNAEQGTPLGHCPKKLPLQVSRNV